MAHNHLNLPVGDLLRESAQVELALQESEGAALAQEDDDVRLALALSLSEMGQNGQNGQRVERDLARNELASAEFVVSAPQDGEYKVERNAIGLQAKFKGFCKAKIERGWQKWKRKSMQNNLLAEERGWDANGIVEVEDVLSREEEERIQKAIEQSLKCSVGETQGGFGFDGELPLVMPSREKFENPAGEDLVCGPASAAFRY